MNNYGFLDIYNQLKELTLLSEDRCKQIWDKVVMTKDLEGDMAECGVYQGASAKLIYLASQGKSLHLFDTYSGLPPEHCDPDDWLTKPGALNVNINDTFKLLSDCPNITHYIGLVPNTLLEVEDKTFCFVHLDMDLYTPTIYALRFFWGRLVRGGIIILDDANWIEGIYKAVTEFQKETGEVLITTAYKQGMFIKR
jgi:O-methyltransferase